MDRKEFLKTIGQKNSIPSNQDFFEFNQKNLEDLLKERKEQRSVIFKFAIRITKWSLFFLLVLLLTQAIVRIFISNFSLFNGAELEILSVSVFGQAIGIVYIITKSLWNDRDYLNKL